MSEQGIYFRRPLSETTTCHLLMSKGKIGLDHYEIRPLSKQTP